MSEPMTAERAKEIVLAKYPKAVSVGVHSTFSQQYKIWTTPNGMSANWLGKGFTSDDAWLNAAMKLKEKP